jgi:hypothetical protein
MRGIVWESKRAWNCCKHFPLSFYGYFPGSPPITTHPQSSQYSIASPTLFRVPNAEVVRPVANRPVRTEDYNQFTFGIPLDDF